jgi:pyruvate dehydrogenase E1 component beta subunit
MATRLNMVEAIDQALLQEMQRDAKVVVLGEDVGRDGGVFRVTDGLIQRFGEERVIDTPLAESGIVGMAIGMASHILPTTSWSRTPRVCAIAAGGSSRSRS